MPSLPHVVLDTNVVVSAFLTPGKSRTIVELAAKRRVLVYSSPAIEDELRRTLRQKLSYTNEEITQALLTYQELIHRFVYPKEKLKIIKADLTDNRILEAAVEARADLIITGDQHLLALGKYRSISIMSPSDFLLQHLGK